jgi:hypothetical protein
VLVKFESLYSSRTVECHVTSGTGDLAVWVRPLSAAGLGSSSGGSGSSVVASEPPLRREASAAAVATDVVAFGVYDCTALPSLRLILANMGSMVLPFRFVKPDDMDSLGFSLSRWDGRIPAGNQVEVLVSATRTCIWEGGDTNRFVHRGSFDVCPWHLGVCVYLHV